jgi:CheY-like chemotaxis protein
MEKKILFVDDEQKILDGLRRQFHSHYNVSIATSGLEGIKLLEKEDFAVIVSDMRMPGMDGAEFLTEAKKRSPNSIRMMLTGYSDIDSAISAVNDGNVFRFITKPCPSDVLKRFIDDGIRQHHLIKVEKELLEHTLNGSIQMLVDILAITNPLAFNRSKKIKYIVTQLAELLDLPQKWQFNVAALLSQVGFITVPMEVMTSYFNKEELSIHEQEMIDHHPQVSFEMVNHIPRLDKIALMIKHQYISTSDALFNTLDESVKIGANLLRISNDIEISLSQGHSFTESIHIMKQSPELYNPSIVDCLTKVDLGNADPNQIKNTPIESIYLGMTLEEDVSTTTGVLLAVKGMLITPMMRFLLINYNKQGLIKKTLLIREIPPS